MTPRKELAAEEKRALALRLGSGLAARENLLLSNALSEVGSHVESGVVLFGVEVNLRNGNEPRVKLRIEPGRTLRETLEDLVRQLPDYTYEALGDQIINVYPKKARDAQGNPMNIRVRRFDVVNESAGRLITWPQRYIPELMEQINPRNSGRQRIFIFTGPAGIGPRVTLHLQDVTVRQILNAVSQASLISPESETPLGWTYMFETEGTSTTGIHSWRSLISVPPDWKKQLKAGPYSQ